MKEIYLCVFVMAFVFAVFFSIYSGVVCVGELARAYHQRRHHGVYVFGEGLVHGIITICAAGASVVLAKLVVAIYLF